jgi:hypothetical protein
MKRYLQAALCAAGLAAFAGAAGAAELRLPPSLTAFGASAGTAIPSASAFAESQLGGPASRMSQDVLAGEPLTLKTSFGIATMPQDFAASVALSAKLAIDTGYNVDLTQRFDNYDGLQSPLIAQSGFMKLAGNGHYAGVTYMPAPNLHLRFGAAQWSDRADRLGLAQAATGLPLAFDQTSSQSILGGMSWDMSDWADLGISGLHDVRQGLGLSSLTAGKMETDALEMTARLKLGNGWVTTASYSQGFSQLDQRNATPAIDARSYSIAIAKHGLFGEDALGFSFSRPALGMLDNNSFSAVAASGDLPPLFIANDRFSNRTQETDLQLGYVTSFLDGALALQANAAYQMNYQGQTGATSVSLLSRAKIKF